jgi:hypothetical protein
MRYLLVLIAGGIIFSSCHKTSRSTAYRDTGTILGQAPFMTACGGAYWIRINDTAAGRTTFDTLPTGCGIDPNFPTFSDSIKVNLNWHYMTPNNCDIIVVDAIERAE